MSDDAAPLKAFDADDDGAAGPTFTSGLSGAQCWDTFYSTGDNRLYVALTDGRLGIYDSWLNTVDDENGGTSSEDDFSRVITPVNADGTVLAVNFHGVHNADIGIVRKAKINSVRLYVVSCRVETNNTRYVK